MDESASNRNVLYCRRQKRCVPLLNTTNNYAENDNRARSKTRPPRAMSTIVEENLNTQLRDVNQNVLELLDAAGRRIARCESTHAMHDSSTTPESSATNSNVSTTASNPSATSHDIESLTFCSSRKSRSYHFATAKQSAAKIEGNHPRINRQKRRLRRHSVVSKVRTKKALSNSDICSQQFFVYPVHVEMPGNLRRSALQKNHDKINEQRVSENPTPPQNVSHIKPDTTIDTNKHRNNPISKYPEKNKDSKRDAVNDRENHHKKVDVKTRHREKHRGQKYRNCSPSSSVEDNEKKHPKEKPHKKRVMKKHSKDKIKEKRAKSKSPHKVHTQAKLSKNEETQVSDENIHPKRSEKSTSPLRCNREEFPKISTKEKKKEKEKTHKHMDCGDSAKHGRTHEPEAYKIKESKQTGLTNTNGKSKKRKENEKEELEKYNERKKAKRESSLVRIKHSILQLAGLGKLGERKRSKSNKNKPTLDKSPLRSPSRDKAPQPKSAQGYTVNIKVSLTSHMRTFLEQDNANLSTLCSCEPITPEKKAKPTITRAQLGSLEIPAFKQKDKRRDSRRRHRKHHKNDEGKIRVDTGTMPYNRICEEKIQDSNLTKNNLTNLKISSECKPLKSNSSLCGNPTLDSVISSYDSHETFKICDNNSITTLGDMSNLMIVSEFASTEDRSISIRGKDDVSTLLPFSEHQYARDKSTNSILESLCTSPKLDNFPTFLMEPYCYMTLNTTLNKQNIKNKRTNTDLVWTRECLQIDHYSDAIQRVKPYIEQSRNRRTIFKRSQNKLLPGNRYRRRTQQECTSDTLLSNLLDNSEKHHKSKIPVFFNDKRILPPKNFYNYLSDVSSFVDDKSDKKASRIPRLKLNSTLQNISELNRQNSNINNNHKWDSSDLAIDLDSSLLEELTKSKDLINLEEELIDIYWDDTDSIPDMKIDKKAKPSDAEKKGWFNNICNKEKVINGSASNSILNNVKNQDLKETRGAGKSMTNKMVKKFKKHERKSGNQEIDKTQVALKRQGSNHDDLPQKDLSAAKTSADSSAETNMGYTSTFKSEEQNGFDFKSATKLSTDVRALANVASKDTQPSNTTTFIVNLADLEDAHINTYSCNSKAMLKDGLRRIGSKINMGDAIRKVGSREKHSVSLQVLVPSRNADTNTSWSNFSKVSARKKTPWKSKLPLRINRSKQSIKNSYTFPIEIDLAKIGLSEFSGNSVSDVARVCSGELANGQVHKAIKLQITVVLMDKA